MLRLVKQLLIETLIISGLLLYDIFLKLIKNIVKISAKITPFKKLKIDRSDDSDKPQQQQNQTNMSKIQNNNQIIIALDIINILIQKSRTKQDRRFQKLNANIKLSFWQKILSFITNVDYGYYFKYIPNYLKFIQDLKNIKNVKLIIYTIEQKYIADLILKKLKLDEQFPENCRKYKNSCRNMSNGLKKHPALIQKQNTSRFIILTSDVNQCDDSNGSDRYFIFIKEKNNLNKYVQLLKNVIQKNKVIEQFHNQLQQQCQNRNL